MLDIIDIGVYFSFSADKVRDISNREQLAVTLRFLDKTGKINSIFSVVSHLTIAMLLCLFCAIYLSD